VGVEHLAVLALLGELGLENGPVKLLEPHGLVLRKEKADLNLLAIRRTRRRGIAVRRRGAGTCGEHADGQNKADGVHALHSGISLHCFFPLGVTFMWFALLTACACLLCRRLFDRRRHANRGDLGASTGGFPTSWVGVSPMSRRCTTRLTWPPDGLRSLR